MAEIKLSGPAKNTLKLFVMSNQRLKFLKITMGFEIKIEFQHRDLLEKL